jgi:hypothetical protein
MQNQANNCATCKLELKQCDALDLAKENTLESNVPNEQATQTTGKQKYNECKEQLVILENKLNEINSIQNDPHHFVYNYFEKIINQIDLQRERIKFKLDLYSEDLINNLKLLQAAESNATTASSCDKLIVNIRSQQMVTFMQLFAHLKNKFESNCSCERAIEELLERISELKPKLDHNLNELENSLLSNKSIIFCESKSLSNMEKFFGFLHVINLQCV